MVLPWLATGWLVGIAAGARSTLEIAHWLTLAAVATLAVLSTRRHRAIPWAFAALVCLCLGASRARHAIDQTIPPSASRVEVLGTIAGLPSRRGDDQVFVLDPRRVSEPGPESSKPVGRLRVVADPDLNLRRGETVLAVGDVRPTSAQERLEVAGVLYATSVRRLAPAPPGPIAVLDDLRLTLLDRLHEVLPAKEASLVAGVLLGIEETMPDPLREAFRATGTAHILAVSGFNVTIVAGAALAAFGTAFGARLGAAAAALAVLGYTLLVGGDPPVLRAAIMAGIVLLAGRLGRQPSPLPALAAAAVGMTLASPGTLYDVGFQLSFMATLGLVVIARPLTHRLRRVCEERIRPDALRPILLLVGETIVVTFAAQISTFPITAYNFQQFPVTALPANALILPAQPPLMAAGAATAVLALVSESLGRLASWTVWPFAAFTVRVAEAFAAVPHASFELPPLPWTFVAGAYAMLGGAVWLAGSPWRSAAGRVLRGIGWVPAMLAAAILTAGIWKLGAEQPDGLLRVTALPAGAVLIETAEGRFVAISTTPTQAGLAVTLDSQLPLSHASLDWLVLTDPQAGWKDATEALRRHGPSGILISAGGILSDPGSTDPAESPPAVFRGEAGSRLDLGNDSRLEILDSSSGRWSAEITMDRMQILLLEAGGFEANAPSLGRRGSTAIILLGPGRRVASALRGAFAYPAPIVIIGCPTPGEPFPVDASRPPPPTRLATPRHGWIRIETDGTTVRVSTERDG